MDRKRLDTILIGFHRLRELCGELHLEPARFSMQTVEQFPSDLAAAMERRRAFVELDALTDGATRLGGSVA